MRRLPAASCKRSTRLVAFFATVLDVPALLSVFDAILPSIGGDSRGSDCGCGHAAAGEAAGKAVFIGRTAEDALSGAPVLCLNSNIAVSNRR